MAPLMQFWCFESFPLPALPDPVTADPSRPSPDIPATISATPPDPPVPPDPPDVCTSYGRLDLLSLLQLSASSSAPTDASSVPLLFASVGFGFMDMDCVHGGGTIARVDGIPIPDPPSIILSAAWLAGFNLCSGELQLTRFRSPPSLLTNMVICSSSLLDSFLVSSVRVYFPARYFKFMFIIGFFSLSNTVIMTIPGLCFSSDLVTRLIPSGKIFIGAWTIMLIVGICLHPLHGLGPCILPGLYPCILPGFNPCNSPRYLFGVVCVLVAEKNTLSKRENCFIPSSFLKERSSSLSSLLLERMISNLPLSQKGCHVSDSMFEIVAVFSTVLFSCVAVCTGPEEATKLVSTIFGGGDWLSKSSYVTISRRLPRRI